MKKILGLMVMVSLLLMACNSPSTEITDTTIEDVSSTSVITDEIRDKAVIIVGELYFSTEEFQTIFDAEKVSFSEKNGEAALETEYEGIKYRDMIKTSMLNSIEEQLLIIGYIKQKGTEISDELVEEHFAKILENHKEVYEKRKQKFGFTDEFTKDEIRRSLYIKAFNEELESEMAKDTSEVDKIIDEEIVQVKARHILVDSEEKALELKQRLEGKSATDDSSQETETSSEASGESGGEGESEEVSFVDLAADHSSCPSSQQGGDLGYFGRGMMAKEFEDAAFAAEIGVVTEPIKTDFGYHLILVEDKRTVQKMKDDGAAEHDVQMVVNAIKQRVLHDKFRKKIEEIRSQTKIEVFVEKIK